MDYDTTDIGITFQMSLDSFLEEAHPVKTSNQSAYKQALQKLEETKLCRSYNRKATIAKEALAICPDCIEAYMILGGSKTDIYERMDILKTGMELATMNLGKDFFLRDVHDFFALEEAKPLFHIKFAYATTLYEAGYMRKASKQFQEMLNLHPQDKFQARYYLFAILLYLEELEACRSLLDKVDTQDTFSCFVRFLYAIKRKQLSDAKQYIRLLKKENPYLFDMLTYTAMNTVNNSAVYEQGSIEEASHLYRIFSKVIQPMEYVHIFILKQDL